MPLGSCTRDLGTYAHLYVRAHHAQTARAALDTSYATITKASV